MRTLSGLANFLCAFVVGALLALVSAGGGIELGRSAIPSSPVRVSWTHYDIGDRGRVLSVDLAVRGHLPSRVMLRYRLTENGAWSAPCSVTVVDRARGYATDCVAPAGSTAVAVTNLAVVLTEN